MIARLLLEPATPGTRILACAWLNFATTAIVAVPFAFGLDALEFVVAGVCLVSLTIGVVVWVVAFAVALGRTTRGDDVAVSNWVFLSGSAPRPVQMHFLLVAFLTLALTAATTAANPFVWLANLLPLGLSALWGARHGTFPPRRVGPLPRTGSRGTSKR